MWVKNSAHNQILTSWTLHPSSGKAIIFVRSFFTICIVWSESQTFNPIFTWFFAPSLFNYLADV